MRTPRLTLLLAFAAVFAVGAPARAQIDQPSWGLAFGFAPLWKVPDGLGTFVDASTLDVSGREFSGGIIRGTTSGGEWGVTLVHKRLSKESVATLAQTNGSISLVTDDAELLGVEVNRFFPFARAGRVQVGVNLGGGVAQMHGFATVTSAARSSASVRAPIGLSEVLELAGNGGRVFPLARAEIAASATVGDRVKVRVGSGFSMPGIQLVSVTVSTLLGPN